MGSDGVGWRTWRESRWMVDLAKNSPMPLYLGDTRADGTPITPAVREQDDILICRVRSKIVGIQYCERAPKLHQSTNQATVDEGCALTCPPLLHRIRPWSCACRRAGQCCARAPQPVRPQRHQDYLAQRCVRHVAVVCLKSSTALPQATRWAISRATWPMLSRRCWTTAARAL